MNGYGSKCARLITLTTIQMQTITVCPTRNVGVPKKRAKPSALTPNQSLPKGRGQMGVRGVKPQIVTGCRCFRRRGGCPHKFLLSLSTIERKTNLQAKARTGDVVSSEYSNVEREPFSKFVITAAQELKLGALKIGVARDGGGRLDANVYSRRQHACDGSAGCYNVSARSRDSDHAC